MMAVCSRPAQIVGQFVEFLVAVDLDGLAVVSQTT